MTSCKHRARIERFVAGLQAGLDSSTATRVNF